MNRERPLPPVSAQLAIEWYDPRMCQVPYGPVVRFRNMLKREGISTYIDTVTAIGRTTHTSDDRKKRAAECSEKASGEETMKVIMI